MTTRRAFLLGSAAAVAAPAFTWGDNKRMGEFMNEYWGGHAVGGVYFREVGGEIWSVPCENERFGEDQ